MNIQIITCPQPRKEIVDRYNKSEKGREAQRRWRETSTRVRRNEHYSRRYGITLVEYEDRHEAANGVCECCGSAETARDHRTGNVRNLSVDHDHATGRVRGLLCKNCNFVIGGLEKDTTLYEKIVRYLAK